MMTSNGVRVGWVAALLSLLVGGCGWVDAGVSGGSAATAADPVANPGGYTVVQGQTLTVPASKGVLAGNSDPQAKAVLVTSPKHAAKFSLLPDGGFTYVNDGSPSTQDSFGYAIQSSSGKSAQKTVQLTIKPANQPPITSDVTLETTVDTPAAGQILATDPEGGAITFKAGTPPTSGTATVDPSGAFNYVPNQGFVGTDTFSVIVADPQWLTSTANVTVNVVPVLGGTPEKPNQPPTVKNLSLTVAEGGTVEAPLNANDPDGDPLTYAVSTPAHGAASVTAQGTVQYVPKPNYSGNDSFTVTVTDPSNASATATVSVKVTPINHAPVASNSDLAVAAGQRVESTFHAQDPDNNPLKFTIVQQPSLGTATLLDAKTGRFAYQSAPDASGTDTIRFKASDGKLTSNEGTVTIKIQPPPVASDACFQTNQKTALTETLTPTYAHGADGSTVLTFTTVNPPAKGSLKWVDAGIGQFQYTPDLNKERGRDQFTYQVTDALGGSAQGTVSVVIAKTIMALGDSTTEGIEALDQPVVPLRVGYRKAVYDSLQKDGYPFQLVGSQNSGQELLTDPDHEGHDSYTADAIAANVYQWLDTNPADLVLLYVGADAPLSDAAGVGRILDEIARWRDDHKVPVSVLVARIINQNPPDPNGYVSAFDDSVAQLVAARTDDVQMVDLQHAFWLPGSDPNGAPQPDPTLYADQLHPNDAGYVRMAATWYPAILKHLDKCR